MAESNHTFRSELKISILVCMEKQKQSFFEKSVFSDALKSALSAGLQLDGLVGAER